MSETSYQGEGPESMRAKLDGWTKQNCTSYSGLGLEALGEGVDRSVNNDRPPLGADTGSMTNPTDYRHELALRDDLLRKELEVRQAAFQRELDAREQTHVERTSAILKRLEDRDTIIDAKLDTLSDKVQNIDAKVGGFEAKLEANMRSTVSQVRSANREVLLGMLAIGVATVLGVWGVNSTIISSASGIFSSGQEDQKSQQASEQLLRDTQEILRKVQEQQAAPPPASALPSPHAPSKR